MAAGKVDKPVFGRFGFRFGHSISSHSSRARLAAQVIAMGGTNAQRRKRERRGLRVPSRQRTVFQAEAGKFIASSRTESG